MSIIKNNLLSYQNEDNIICKLTRCDTPLESKVILDAGTDKAQEAFDFDFDGVNKFYPFKFPEELKNLDFNILVITGASGAGKSVFSKYFGKEEEIKWDLNKAIISNFESPDEAVSKLNAVGLASIPTWCKPYNVLSIGESFRADLARRLKSNCVIDEFTSTVDRNVALSCASSVSKYIRKNNLTKCVFVSCHKDYIDVLCPDYVIDLDDECIYDTRRLPKREFNLSIYEREDKAEIWNLFRKHHYLSAELNTSASKVYIAYLNNQPVAFCAVISAPGRIHYHYRIHRLVVLPDYQGLGIATKLLTEVCKYYTSLQCFMTIRTSHVKLISYMRNRSNIWREIEDPTLGKKTNNGLWNINTKRRPISFQYIGPTDNCLINNPNLVIPIKEQLAIKKNKLF